MAYLILPMLILPHIHHFHPLVAFYTSRQAETLLAWCLCCDCHFRIAGFPLYGTTSKETCIWGCPFHALATLLVHLLECFLVGVSRRTVIRPVRVLFGFGGAGICVVQYSC